MDFDFYMAKVNKMNEKKKKKLNIKQKLNVLKVVYTKKRDKKNDKKIKVKLSIQVEG